MIELLILVVALAALVVSLLSLMVKLRVRLGRLTLGFIAAFVWLGSAAALSLVETWLFGVIHYKLIPYVTFFAGAGVFVLADKLDLIAEPETESLGLSLNAREEAAPGREEGDSTSSKSV